MRRRDLNDVDIDKPDINRLTKVMRFEEADRVPHLEFWVTSKPVYEFVLGRKIEYEIVDARLGEQSITPEDHVEFAYNLGMDAVACNFSWRPGNVFKKASDGTEHYIGGRITTRDDIQIMERPPDLEKQLRYLERYLNAARGTRVGVFANFTSFFDSAMLAVGVERSLYLFKDDRTFMEEVMDILLENQIKVVEDVCSEFGDKIAFVLVNDDIACNSGLMIDPETFREIFVNRMRRLIAPAKKMVKLCVMHTDGEMESVLPILYEVGFNGAHPIEPESNDIFELKKKWYGRMVLFGNIPTVLLAYGTKENIENTVKEYCERLSSGGGWVLGSSTSIMEGILPENFVTMTRAAHKFGIYESLNTKIS
jgi:uroporphyrinogen-III decarboxylase